MSEDLGKDLLVEATKAVAADGYKDTLHPTMKAIGSIIALPFQAIDAALSKPKLWVAEKQYNYQRTRKLLAEKLKDTPEELIVPPENHIAVPALQQIAYCFDSDEIRDMYANLLANSMNKVVKNGVHPGFVEIIKQLSPDEAKILKAMRHKPTVPTITLRYSHRTIGAIEIIKDFSLIGEQANCENPYDVDMYFNNLLRLGLIIEGRGYAHLADESVYEPLTKHRMIAPHACNEKAKAMGYESYNFFKNYVELTSYGRRFCDICMQPIKVAKNVSSQNEPQSELNHN